MAKKHNQSKVKLGAANRLFMGIVIIVMIIICVIIIYPIYYVLLASITDPVTVNSGKVLLYPESPYLEGYKTTLAYKPLWVAYGNTILYTVVGTIVSLIATVPAGYALSRKDK